MDSMSSFGVKCPLLKHVITHNFSYKSAEDIFKFLCENEHECRTYSVLDVESWKDQRKDRDELFLDEHSKLHVISYFLNGYIQGKENLCSCDSCILGKFVECNIVKGKILFLGNEQ